MNLRHSLNVSGVSENSQRPTSKTCRVHSSVLSARKKQDKTEHSPPQMEGSPPNKLAEARPSLSEPALKDLLRNGTVTPERYSHETGYGVIEAMSQLDLACEA